MGRWESVERLVLYDCRQDLAGEVVGLGGEAADERWRYEHG